MSLTKRKRYPNNAARRTIGGGVGALSWVTRRTQITIVDQTLGDTTVVTFDQAVSLAGIPQWPNNSGHMPEAAELTAPNELTLTYPAADTTTSFTVPYQSLGVRNGGGGFVLPGTFSAPG